MAYTRPSSTDQICSRGDTACDWAQSQLPPEKPTVSDKIILYTHIYTLQEPPPLELTNLERKPTEPFPTSPVFFSSLEVKAKNQSYHSQYSVLSTKSLYTDATPFFFYLIV